MSDIHLGTRGCQAELLLDFLKHNDAGTVYLVGDMIDGWQLKNRWYWPQAHNDVVQKLLRKVRQGTCMTYVPGNHDEFARGYSGYIGVFFGGVEVADHAYHMTADKKRLLVVHGDQFDIVVKHARWLAFLGDWAYTFALWLNLWLNKIRRKLGFTYWSLSAWAKLSLGETQGEERGKLYQRVRGGLDGGGAAASRRRRRLRPYSSRRDPGITYVNIGDFVESCTAIVEHHDGRLEILHRQMTAEERRSAADAATEKSRTDARAAA